MKMLVIDSCIRAIGGGRVWWELPVKHWVVPSSFHRLLLNPWPAQANVEPQPLHPARGKDSCLWGLYEWRSLWHLYLLGRRQRHLDFSLQYEVTFYFVFLVYGSTHLITLSFCQSMPPDHKHQKCLTLMLSQYEEIWSHGLDTFLSSRFHCSARWIRQCCRVQCGDFAGC